MEISRIFGIEHNANNERLWAFYCYHYDIGTIHDKAFEIASCHRQGELRDPVTAFQHWLSTNNPKGGAK